MKKVISAVAIFTFVFLVGFGFASTASAEKQQGRSGDYVLCVSNVVFGDCTGINARLQGAERAYWEEFRGGVPTVNASTNNDAEIRTRIALLQQLVDLYTKVLALVQQES